MPPRLLACFYFATYGTEENKKLRKRKLLETHKHKHSLCADSDEMKPRTARNKKRRRNVTKLLKLLAWGCQCNRFAISNYAVDQFIAQKLNRTACADRGRQIHLRLYATLATKISSLSKPVNLSRRFQMCHARLS